MKNSYLEDFENYMLVIKGRSSSSIKTYDSSLREFFSFIYERKGIKDSCPVNDKILKSIDINDGRAYVVWCSNKGNNANTRNRKVITVRLFFNYVEENYGINSSIKKLEISKTEKKLPKYLSEKEALELLNVAKVSKRDYAIILMLLTCGLRVSEIASLDIDDIRNDNTIIITGKGNKQRKVYLTQDLINAIISYLNTRTDDSPWLWNSKNGTKLSKISIQFLVKDYLTKIGREDCSVHKLRHTFATLMYQSGSADLLQLQTMLGHNSVSTTQIYTHVADDQLAECVKHNPLINKKPMKKVDKKPNIKVLAS